MDRGGAHRRRRRHARHARWMGAGRSGVGGRAARGRHPAVPRPARFDLRSGAVDGRRDRDRAGRGRGGGPVGWRRAPGRDRRRADSTAAPPRAREVDSRPPHDRYRLRGGRRHGAARQHRRRSSRLHPLHGAVRRDHRPRAAGRFRHGPVTGPHLPRRRPRADHARLERGLCPVRRWLG